MANAAGKGCRLTWLINVDFGGLVPTWAVQHVVVTSAAFPRIQLLELEEHTRNKKKVFINVIFIDGNEDIMEGCIDNSTKFTDTYIECQCKSSLAFF